MFQVSTMSVGNFAQKWDSKVPTDLNGGDKEIQFALVEVDNVAGWTSWEFPEGSLQLRVVEKIKALYNRHCPESVKTVWSKTVTTLDAKGAPDTTPVVITVGGQLVYRDESIKQIHDNYLVNYNMSNPRGEFASLSGRCRSLSAT